MDIQYANIIAYRITANELVLEFGNFFAGQDNNRQTPDHTDFKTRIILPAGMLDVMVQALNEAKGARDTMRREIGDQPVFKLNRQEEKRA